MAVQPKGAEAVAVEYDTLFIETSLGTRLATVIPKSLSVTVLDVKGKIELLHPHVFKNMGDITILDLQVVHQGYKYSLDDSMPLACAFVDSGTESKSLFVSVELVVDGLDDVGTDVGLPDVSKRAKKDVASNANVVGVDNKKRGKVDNSAKADGIAQISLSQDAVMEAVQNQGITLVPCENSASAQATLPQDAGMEAIQNQGITLLPCENSAKADGSAQITLSQDAGMEAVPNQGITFDKSSKADGSSQITLYSDSLIAMKVAADNVVGVDKKNDSVPQTENDIFNIMDLSVPAGPVKKRKVAEDTKDAAMEAVQNQEGNENVVAGTLSGNRKEKKPRKRGKKEQSVGVVHKEKKARKKSQRQHVESSELKGVTAGEANGEIEKEGEANGETDKTLVPVMVRME